MAETDEETMNIQKKKEDLFLLEIRKDMGRKVQLYLLRSNVIQQAEETSDGKWYSN